MMNTEVVEFDVHSELYQAACLLRQEILRLPIGLDLFAEDLSQENNCRHFGVLSNKQLIAYLLIVPQADKSVTLRQMCVVEAYRGQGVGRRLIQHIEESLKQSEIEMIELAARVQAVPFYERLGYRCVGEEFDSVGIPHRKMDKIL
ncbi:GNAT family N-acetyltransferase [Planctomicrobium sp.]|jgi:predicted GNAT family N-acyltransferase|nr:GNAT family N-acetyltransferase [Planctomicrobium sp.]MBT5020590.1 GNAT family N-acetyltransferase [Planctomicrobium sp.]MDB4731715.1 GNAT family N-acetyltransferase [bacterium]MDB4744025.1 GNAT family N-acetyltransferase [Planctomicrobium sp.]MDB4802463.1 GNAT family N-acetyltransferase [bacterium]